jgi:hypothetical protein
VAATVTSVRGSRGYAIVEFQLAERSGALCAGGRGAAAFGAIRVRDGRITDWFRLPDPGRAGRAPTRPPGRSSRPTRGRRPLRIDRSASAAARSPERTAPSM